VWEVSRHDLLFRFPLFYASTFISSRDAPGQCFTRRSLGKSNRVESGRVACHNIQMYITHSGFLQENFFRIFLSPCGIVVYGAKYFLDPRSKRRASAGVLVF
jgi:hypothetical protein